ncbi:MAG: tetratricopeptide repeat protein [Candidatus Nitrotoga sp.]|nr:sel1 repeat family protein [Candidatus Nitrotoga sp.]MDW7535291.1 tetratricopeptide repeat protein [Candidatus Nitrotoga sp.]MDW7604412.1 tetratricopeptide repeat protein [Candidatus Nitrotoga sp.]
MTLLCLTGGVSASPFEEGVAKYKNADYVGAINAWRLASATGNARAQLNLGVMYAKGQGVAQDYAEAFKWSRLAAAQGNADAQYSLGVMYDRGQGVAQDYAEAFKWYRLAAEQGDADAQYSLGVMYDEGQGVTQNHVRAYTWWSLSAASGQTNAKRVRELAAKNMTSQQILEAQKMIRECQHKKLQACT